MAKINFNLRDPKSIAPTPIRLVVRWNNQKLVYSTGESICPMFWNLDTQQAKETKKFPQFPEFNLKLRNLHTLVINTFRSFENTNSRQPSVEELKEQLDNQLLRSEKSVSYTLNGFIEKFREEAKFKTNLKTGIALAPKTLTTYKQLQDLLLEYNRIRKTNIDFKDVDLDFYNDFTKFLTIEKQFAVNNIGKHIKTLKTILNEATERGINENLKFKNKRFSVLKQDVDSIYLTYQELKAIETLDLNDNSKLDKVKDLFLVGCYTGLRFSDFTNISHQNIKDDILEIQTQKTGEMVAIPIHNVVKNILNKYENNFNSPLPPPLSNQKMNEYLKEICKKIDFLNERVTIKETKGGQTTKIELPKYELITTHTARRSFATNNFKAGIPSQVIMKITGHRSEKMFLSYIKVTPTENAEIMRLYWNKDLN